MSQNRTVTIVQPNVLQKKHQNVVLGNDNNDLHDNSYQEEGVTQTQSVSLFYVNKF